MEFGSAHYPSMSNINPKPDFDSLIYSINDKIKQYNLPIRISIH